MAQHLTEKLKKLEEYYFKKPIKEDAVQLLSGGHSSFANNYRIEYAGKTYFARFMLNKQPLASREKECLITDYVGKMGIGPKVYYQNPQQGIILTEFIQGRTAKLEDMINAPNRDLIIANVKKLHQTVAPTFPKARTIAAQIQALLKRADSSMLQQQLQTLELMGPLNSLFHCEENNLTPAFIHGDFNPNNILISNHRVYFIDWTDAGMGDPYADISWHAICFPLSLHDNLLRYYFGDIDTLMKQKLRCYYCLRLFVRVAWCVDQAKMISKDSEYLLIDILNQQNLPEPYSLMVDLSAKKITLDNPNNLLLVSATMLHFLSHFTKTDSFLSAIEALSHHA